MSKEINRNIYWDIVRCLAIIGVVLGHCVYNGHVIVFVYFFQLPVFFFVSGFLFDKDKWAGKTASFAGKKIATAWIRYAIYGLLFVLQHNFFVRAGALPDDLYNHTAMLEKYVQTLIFSPCDALTGPLWFVPVWILSVCLFAFIVEFSRIVTSRFCKTTKINVSILQEIITATLVIICCAVGLFLYQRNANTLFHIHTSFLAIGYVYMGYALRNFGKDFKKHLHWWMIPVCAAILIIAGRKFGIYINLNMNIFPGVLAYIVTAVGILMILSLSKYLEKLSFLRKPAVLIGTHTFDIMALHFTVFKLIDIVFTKFYTEYPEYLSLIPNGYSWIIWPVYLVLGIAIPSLIGWLVDKALLLFKA